MALVVIATSGASNANSYLTRAEADSYFEARLPLDPPWEDADPEVKDAAIVMATRLIDAMFRPSRRLVADPIAHYIIGRQWTGTPATTTQRLAWPRSGMYDQNGNAIASSVIPQELKDATAEFAGQLIVGDTSLNNDVIVNGLTSLRVSDISMSFKDSFTPTVVPDASINLLLPSWYTEEQWENANQALFDVVSE